MRVTSAVMALLLLAAFGFFAYSTRRLVRIMQLAKQPLTRTDQPGARVDGVLRFVFGNQRLFKDPIPGLMHFLIFWGFVILTVGTVEMFGQGLHPALNLAFLGRPIYGAIYWLQDVFALLVSIAIVWAIARRLFFLPRRMQGLDRHARIDGLIILGLILALMVTLVLSRGAAIALGAPEGPGAAFQPVSRALVPLYTGWSPPAMSAAHVGFWWAHVLIVLGFLVYLPFSKHLHILAATPNVYFRKLEPVGRLSKPNLEDESVETFGANQLKSFSWRDVLDGYSCTECGRCTNVCPANVTGKPLDPRKIITDIRAFAAARGAAAAAKANGDAEEPGIIGTYTTEEELWACTTCGACVEACPVLIEHVQKIVDERRHLVLMESRFPKEAQGAMRGFETQSNPWGLPVEERLAWAEGLSIRTLAEHPTAEYLYFVGCAGAYDDRNKKVSRAFVQILNAAGVDFAVLGREERCNGECARRIGNEYLAQSMMGELAGILKQYQVKKIITACPHCFNTLKNEYPEFGVTCTVEHHSEFIGKLVSAGKLKLAATGADVVYHDS
ncbi:MAG TPA: (Fe-S)-binding protein, partial [Candidatus Udaeobacter sp.]|nr:(Fe-S)-binding protein [Candidatus Udaeobacter sp.]